MADGDVVLRDIQVCKYVNDGGKTYLHRTLSFYQTQAALGWDTASGADIVNYDNMPRGLKPRTWLAWNADDHTQRARIPVATNADYIAAVPNTTTVKVIYRGYELTMTVYQLEGERRRGKTTDTAVQASLPL